MDISKNFTIMKLSYIFLFFVLLTIIMFDPAEGRQLILKPMSASEVYQVLKAAGREDAIPEGRVVTQGLSALTGFTVGLAKGIGGTLLVNLATAGFNTSALSSLLGGGSNSGSNSVTSQEICFSSRSLSEINENDINQNGEAKQNTDTGVGVVITGSTSPTVSPTTNTQTGETGTATQGTSPTGTTATSPGGTATTNPATTNTNTGTNTGTNVDNGTGSGTQTATTTNTGPDAATNCIVIQKPFR